MIMKENTTMQDNMIEDLKEKIRELARENERLSRDKDSLTALLCKNRYNVTYKIAKEKERGDVVHDKTRTYHKQLRDLEDRNVELEQEIIVLRQDRDMSKSANESDMIRLYNEL